MKKYLIIFACIIYLHLPLTAQPDQASPDSISDHRKAYLYVRGLEQDEETGFRPLEFLLKKAGYLPRRIIYGIRYTSGYGVKMFNDPKFIVNLESFFVNKQKTFGWYPIVTVVSGIRPRGGISTFYKYRKLKTGITAEYADEEKYSIEGVVSYQLRRGSRTWKMSLSAITAFDDDNIFYGIGQNPTLDPRSHFLAMAADDHGLFYQRRWKIEFVCGVQPRPRWEFYLTSNIRKRILQNAYEVENRFSGDADIWNFFDIMSIHGFQLPLQQLYNEFSLRYDTRDENVYMAEGYTIEGYTGFAFGVENDRSRYLKYGFDALVNIPVIQNNRFIIPRIIFHAVENLDNSAPLAFVDYPTQPLFRGSSRRKLVRIDKYSLLPSIEYQWPLTFSLGAHLFFDYLMVSKSLPKFTTNNSPWAVGFGIDFHALDGELVYSSIAFGSEGIDLSFRLGITALLNNRMD